MGRNTDLKSLFFPVKEEEVYLKNTKTSASRFKAIVGILPEGEELFSIVAREYKLITHERAYNMGKDIYKKIFKGHDPDFDVFNIIAPSTKSFCHIDLISKDYQFDIGIGDNYFPFIRILNSYNKICSLQFTVGFCRAICSNGVIFGERSNGLRFAHTKKTLKSNDLIKISSNFLKSIEADFIRKTKKTLNIELPREYFAPLAAKILNQDLYPNPLEPRRYITQMKKKEKFRHLINEYADEYVPLFKETAYALYNAITHYATNNQEVHVNAIHGLQRKCGIWLTDICTKVEILDFDWNNEIKGYQYLLD